MLAAGIRRWASSGARHAKVCILGGGAGGVTFGGKIVAANHKLVDPAQVTIIDGSPLHHYKPGWTLYQGEEISKRMIVTDMKSAIPDRMNFINQYVERIDPDNNTVILKDGTKVTYEQLIVSTGIQFNWDKVKGLKDALYDQSRNVVSVYNYDSLDRMRVLRHKKFEKAIFTQPSTPITCAGAAQKVMYMTHESWASHGYKPEIKFIQGGSVLFSVPFYVETLKRCIQEKGIINIHEHELIEVKKDDIAVFQNTKTKELVEHKFDFLHAVPPMSGQDYLKGSILADDNNYLLVDKHTLRHLKYPNIWGLGDGITVPTSKTMSAAIEQAYILELNLGEALRGNRPTHSYDGYTACPILVGGGKVILAEFKYDNIIAPSMRKDQREPSRLAFWMKKYIFPFAGLHLMKRGMWQGRRMAGEPKDYSQFQKDEEANRRP